MNENLKKLIQLIQENPELKIITMVNYEVCAEEYGYWSGSFSACEVTKIYTDENLKIYIGEDGFNDLVEKFMNNYEYPWNLTNDEVEEIAKEYISKYPWQDVIVVYIELPE